MFDIAFHFDSPTICCDTFMNKSCMNVNSNVGGNNNDNNSSQKRSRGGGGGSDGGGGRDATLKVIERAEGLLKRRPAAASSSSRGGESATTISPTPISRGGMNYVDMYPLMDVGRFMTRKECNFLSDSFLPLMLGGSLDGEGGTPSAAKSPSQGAGDRRTVVSSDSFVSGKPTFTQKEAVSGAFKSTGLDSSSSDGSEAGRFSLDSVPTKNPGEEDGDSNVIIWTHQADRWQEKFQKLLEFRQRHGHCRIPHNWKVDIALAQWVKRQRYQLKLKQDGKRSTMTKERQDLLDSIGFEWNAHEASWDERFKELQIFKRRHGHCDVPTRDKENPKLSIWVKSQRRQYKLFRMGQPSSMTADRLEKLSELGFEWDPRNHMARSSMTGV